MGGGREQDVLLPPPPTPHVHPKMKDFFSAGVYGEAAARGRRSAGGGKPGRVAPGHPPPCAHPLPLAAAAALAPRVRAPAAEVKAPSPRRRSGNFAPGEESQQREITLSSELRLQVTATQRARGGRRERVAKRSPAQVWRLAGRAGQRGGLRAAWAAGARAWEAVQAREGESGGRPQGRAGAPGD